MASIDRLANGKLDRGVSAVLSGDDRVVRVRVRPPFLMARSGLRDSSLTYRSASPAPRPVEQSCRYPLP